MFRSAVINPSRQRFTRCFAASRIAPAMTDPYKTLGVDKSADKAKIKKAYFNLAKQYHPDSNKDPKAKDKYVEVQAAYEILKDPTKKEQFDTYGAQAFDANGNPQGPGGFTGFGGSPFGGSNPFGGAAGFDFNDIFSAFGGGGGRSSQQQARNQIVVGDAIEVAASVSFMDAAKGASKTITIEPLTKCKPCTGTGLKPGEKKSACVACGGAGTRFHVMQGGFQMQMTCEVCNGAGIVIPRGKECRTCHGEGVVRERKSINVDIPAGIEEGMRLRVAGEGDAPNTSGAPAGVSTRNGDLYVHVRIRPSTEFTREGPHLKYRAQIPMTTAALGGRARIPTLDGSVDIKINPGTNSGEQITMTGKGMPRIGSDARSRGVGDLHVEFKVVMPKRVSPYERNLLEQLAISFGDTTTKTEMNIPPAKPFDSSNSAASSSNTTSTPDSKDQKKGGGIFSSIFDKYRSTETGANTDSASHKDNEQDDEEPKKAAGSV